MQGQKLMNWSIFDEYLKQCDFAIDSQLKLSILNGESTAMIDLLSDLKNKYHEVIATSGISAPQNPAQNRVYSATNQNQNQSTPH